MSLEEEKWEFSEVMKFDSWVGFELDFGKEWNFKKYMYGDRKNFSW